MHKLEYIQLNQDQITLCKAYSDYQYNVRYQNQPGRNYQEEKTEKFRHQSALAEYAAASYLNVCPFKHNEIGSYDLLLNGLHIDVKTTTYQSKAENTDLQLGWDQKENFNPNKPKTYLHTYLVDAETVCLAGYITVRDWNYISQYKQEYKQTNAYYAIPWHELDPMERLK